MDAQAAFEVLVKELLRRDGCSQSTMMGYPCVRRDGTYVLSFDKQNGRLVMKLGAQRRDALVASGEAEAFAPNGRTFKEWCAVAAERSDLWPALADEAWEFAG